jgi:hypothetical protein
VIPFCDFLGVTVPSEVWDELRLEVSAELDSIGMRVEVDEDRSVLWRTPDSFGTVKANRVGKVWSLGASGAVCAGLRVAGRFNDFLAAIGTRPHRVTRLDASLDVQADAPPIVAEVTRSGRAGELSLTRQAIKPSDVTTFGGVRPDGQVTGTVYLGPRRGSARMVVYDKQHERISRKLSDCGPLTRYELRLRAASGVTLRDAAEPASVFWHHVAPDFLPSPSDAPAWVPGGSGFTIERTPPPLPAARLLRRIEGSVELAALVALAESCGPYGIELLVSRIRAMGGAGVSPAAAAVSNCGRADTGDAAVLTTPQ